MVPSPAAAAAGYDRLEPKAGFARPRSQGTAWPGHCGPAARVHYFRYDEKSMQKRLDWAMGCKGRKVRIPRLERDSTLH